MSIQPGDLVMVVRDCCGHWLGRIFTVRSVHMLNEQTEVTCGRCGWIASDCTVAVNERRDPEGVWCCPVSWLKRIEPDVKLEQELEEMAA